MSKSPKSLTYTPFDTFYKQNKPYFCNIYFKTITYYTKIDKLETLDLIN